MWVSEYKITGTASNEAISQVSEKLPPGANQRLHNVPADERRTTGEPIRGSVQPP